METQFFFKTKVTFLESLLDFFTHKADDHVRISDRGRKILDNRELATKIANAIIKGHATLEKGDSIPIQGTDISINLVTSLENQQQ